jgi:hypothetical protein
MILIKTVTLADKVLPSAGKSLFTFMYTRLKNLSRRGVWSLIVAKSASSFAQSDSSGVDAETIALEDILVVGKRASLASAQEIKRNKMEIVDSVVADDINKLPDINVTDALSHVIGALPIYTSGYGWLDASVGYRINEHFSFTIEGMNLLNTLRSSYYGVETRPQSVWVNDTQVGATMTVRF